MKILTWNVNGFNSLPTTSLLAFFKEVSADIICLQELRSARGLDSYKLELISLGYEVTESLSTNGKNGVAILSKIAPIRVIEALGIPKIDVEKRLICNEYDNFFVLNLYAPHLGLRGDNKAKRALWEDSIQNLLRNLKRRKQVIICGDFNFANLKNGGSKPGQTEFEKTSFELLLKLGFVDATQSVSEIHFDQGDSARSHSSLLDHILVQNMNLISSVHIHENNSYSDHTPISAQIDLKMN